VTFCGFGFLASERLMDSVSGARREDAAGDSAGFFPHIRRVFQRAKVPQFSSRMVEDSSQPGGWLRLADERALHFRDAVEVADGAGGVGGGHFFSPFWRKTLRATCAA
jgi:hypothetical protein